MVDALRKGIKSQGGLSMTRCPSTQGGNDACPRFGRSVEKLASPRRVRGRDLSNVRIYARAIRAATASDLRLAGARRPITFGDRSAVRRNSSDVVRRRAEASNAADGNHIQVPTRRTRIASNVDRKTAQWLRKIVRVHAHLCQTVARFGQKQPKRKDELARRLEDGDRTLLLDCVSFAIRDLQTVCDSIDKAMNKAKPTDAVPGSQEKIEILRRRFAASKSLWIEGDKQDVRDGSRD